MGFRFAPKEKDFWGVYLYGVLYSVDFSSGKKKHSKLKKCLNLMVNEMIKAT